MLSYTMRAQLAMMRWASAFFLRLITLTLLSAYQSGVSSMPFIYSRSVNQAQVHQGNAELCVVAQKSKSVEHTILEGWSIPAVGMGMVVLVVVSGTLSGLTLGLMTIDITRLHVLSMSGTPKQRLMANKILPVKKYPYFLLCSLLIASVLVNEMLPIMNTKLFGESYKALFISATLVIVFGEILPQAIFPRYALELGSALIWLVYLCMIVCSVPAAILSGALYYTLRGSGCTQNMFSVEELVTFIELHSEDHINGNGGTLEARTVALIRNIVEAQEKVVGDVARKLESVYMVNGQLELSKVELQKILRSGFSKIPVYETSTEVYEDSGLPKMRFLGYIQMRKLFDLDLEVMKNVRNIGLNPLPIIDNDRPLFDALTILQSENARMALVADPTREIQRDTGSVQEFFHGQYTNPRIQLEVGMGHSTLRYLQNDLLWTNHAHAEKKEIVGIVTMKDIMRGLLRKTVGDARNSNFFQENRDSDEWRNSGDAGVSGSTLRPSGPLSMFDKSSTMTTASSWSTATSSTPSQDERMHPLVHPLGDLDVNIVEAVQSRLSVRSTWDTLEKSHSTRSLGIIQTDGTDHEGIVGFGIGTAVGGGAQIIGTLRRRFSFEDGVDEKGANLLETSK
ncbi:hypothetical protein EV426DRAFT_599728 [Tirmania nivea]|nr:hypothetical protein EV426DRAFT_599728 [Tirmania nivea]